MNIAFREDRAYVTESGPTWATGPQANGKRIVEFAPGADGTFTGGLPATLVEYTGTGKATAAGLATGPDGLYFTDLYKDVDYVSPIDPGANLLRVRWPEPEVVPTPTSSTPATADPLLALVARAEVPLGSRAVRMAVGCRAACSVRTALRARRRLLGHASGTRDDAGQLTLRLRLRRGARRLRHEVLASEQGLGDESFSSRFVRRDTSLARRLRRGLKLNIGCSDACRAVAKLRLLRGAAARMPVASGSAETESAGVARLTARFTRRARRRLRRAGGGRLRLSVEARRGTDEPTVLSYLLRL